MEELRNKNSLLFLPLFLPSHHLKASSGTAASVISWRSNTLLIGEAADLIRLPGRSVMTAGDVRKRRMRRRRKRGRAIRKLSSHTKPARRT